MRRKVMIFALYLFILTVIQSTVVDYIKVYNIKPNLLTIFVISIALLRGNVEGAVVGFFAGLMQDVASGRLIGVYALIGMYLGLILGSVNKRLYRENFVISIFFTFIATILYEFTIYLTVVLTGDYVDILFALLNIIVPEAIYNSIMSIPIFIISVRLHYRLEDLVKAARKY